MAETCGEFVSWWDGEYEGNCELPAGHNGDHWDGLSWFDSDHELTDAQHDGPPETHRPPHVTVHIGPDGAALRMDTGETIDLVKFAR